MKYITDTDFLPDVRDVSYDVYQLLYGVIVNRTETKIYDTLVIMCRKYPDITLRKAKIKSWKSAIDATAEELGRYKASEYQVYIPYAELHCSTESLLNLYRFENNVLDELYAMSEIPPYRKGISKETVQGFYPIPNLVELMRGFGNKCLNDNASGTEISAAIECELARRGLVNDSTILASKTYSDIFFSEENIPKINLSLDEDVATSKEDNDDLLVKTGFLYYALKRYFLDIYKSRSEKEQVVNTALNKATYRIASALYKPSEPVNARGYQAANNTFYQYVRQYSQPEQKATKKALKNKERIEELLKDFYG